MAKGIPSFFVGRHPGISITNAESFTAFRGFASTSPRWRSTNLASPAPIGVATRRYLHVQLQPQLRKRDNGRLSTAIAFRNAASRYPNAGVNVSRGGAGVQSNTIQQLTVSAWISQRRYHNTDGKDSRCACGKELKEPRLGEGKNPNVAQTPSKQPSKEASDPNKTVSPDPDPNAESYVASVSKYLHLPHLPKMPHRPTKEELLAASTGFWNRLQVRFKWLTIRSTRPWNADEWGAFVSWFMLGHLAWILLGTTTFMSLVIFSINTVFAQGTSWPRPVSLYVY